MTTPSPTPPRPDLEPAPDRTVPDAVDTPTGLARVADLRRRLHQHEHEAQPIDSEPDDAA